MLDDHTFKKDSLSRDEGVRLLELYRKWFDKKGFFIHEDSVEFIKKHWRVYATIETVEQGKRTHMFFMTPSYLSMWMGFGKSHGVVMRTENTYKPNKIEEMRRAIEKN